MRRVLTPPFVRSTLVLLLALGAAACGRTGSAEGEAKDTSEEAAADSSGSQTEAVPVEVVVVDRGPMESVLSSSSTLEAESQIYVVAEAARRVRERYVEEGDHVERGDLLVRLQDDEQRSALAKAESLLDQARREFERQQRLRERDLTSDKALNDARSSFEQRQLELEDAQRELGYTQVRAPISGTVVERFVNVGDQVSLGTQLCQIIDFTSLIAYVYVPEKDLIRLEVGQPVRLRVPALGDQSYECSVKRISPIVDARSGTIKVTIDVGDQPGLRPGLYVDIDIVTDIRVAALRVPKRAIVYGEDQLFVFRVSNGGIAHRVLLIPELEDREFVVPASGIAEGDSLVTAGQAGLKDGARVRVVNREAETAIEAARS